MTSLANAKKSELRFPRRQSSRSPMSGPLVAPSNSTVCNKRMCAKTWPETAIFNHRLGDKKCN